ncbi:HAD-IIA family hydrolase [Vallicoccus soli]|uniref:HAD-IIA family hydrolase n=1 Tax=Vallicoccus soli TaxID=2339232 RepID=A0A3A3YVM3_9ACTN|nr:HAD-IIA family hydrolase [Vallicoccus soli]RJK93108.1 HAD-IIA family hydrolase [Vallicoccus soli]
MEQRAQGGHDGVGGQDRPLRGTRGPLHEALDALLLDLDGTVYTGPRPVPGAPEVVGALQGRGVRCCYLTNNASRTAAATAELLAGMGLPATADDVVTSAQAAAALLASELRAGDAVLVVGGEGLEVALRDEGLVPVRSLDDGPRAVVQGFHPSVGWAQLAEAAYGVQAGLPWVATNLDLSIPTDRGVAPGNGSLVAAVRAAVHVDPRVAGKPERALVDAALARTGSRSALVVGDRLDTDIACAVRAGLPSLAVLTGVSDAARLLAAAPGERPTYLAGDLGGLLVEHPDVEQRDGAWWCGGWRAAVGTGGAAGGPSLAVQPAGEERPGGDGWDALRAACAARWAHEGEVLLQEALDALERVAPAVDGRSALAAVEALGDAVPDEG